MPKIPWGKDIELAGIELVLQANANALIRPNYTTNLHAWFLDCIRQDDPELSAILHDEQAEKSFTISNLQGKLIPRAEGFELVSGTKYLWQITGFDHKFCTWLGQWFQNLPHYVNLRVTSFTILGGSIYLKPTTYQALWSESIGFQSNFNLTFTSPTSFRHKKHHLPLPIPENIFHSYLRRWDNFANIGTQNIDTEEFLAWVDEIIFINSHSITCTKVASGKQGFVTGFIGRVEFGIDRKANQKPNFEQLLYVLIQFAPYCGTGHKTTFGLGQTKLGAIANIDLVTASPIQQELIAQRVEQLIEQFIKLKKQQNTERAKKTALLWAMLLARREMGESLQAIALDLEIPYTTAKTYVKLARKALREQQI